MSDYCEHQWKDEQKIEQLEAEIERLQDQITEIPTLCRRYEAKIERLREALENLFEESEPRCDLAEQCFSSGRCGRGAYETPLENAAGGCWFRECHCMSEAQQNAAALLDKMDRKANE